MMDDSIPLAMKDFVTEKKVLALTEIHKNKETYGSEITKKVGTTFAHTIKILNDLEESGLINRELSGRKKIVTLTEDGEEIAEAFVKVLNAFKKADIS